MPRINKLTADEVGSVNSAYIGPLTICPRGGQRVAESAEMLDRTVCNCIIVDMDLRPLHDRVMVKRLEEVEQVRGGIIIPDTAKEKPQQAEVKAVGSGKLLENGERVAPEVKPGDRILFGKFGGAEVKIQGEEYLILREDEILGILE